MAEKKDPKRTVSESMQLLEEWHRVGGYWSHHAKEK